jgi:hypothetical protein
VFLFIQHEVNPVGVPAAVEFAEELPGQIP